MLKNCKIPLWVICVWIFDVAVVGTALMLLWFQNRTYTHPQHNKKD